MVIAIVVTGLPGAVGADPSATSTTVAPQTTAETVTTVTGPDPEVVAAPAAGVTVTVGDETSYRAALVSLSADGSGPHTVVLAADIVVDDGTDPTYTGSQSLTVDGRGFTLDGAGTSRLLVMDSPTDASLSLLDLTLTGGTTSGDGGAVLARNESIAAVTDVTFTGNRATSGGGAIAVRADVNVTRSTFRNNVAETGDGGAIDAVAGTGTFAIVDSLFDGNQAPLGEGGAVSATRGTGIENSTFVANHARQGGGLVAVGFSGLRNMTFTANTATERGGGLLARGPGSVYLIYLTLVGNAAPDGANLASIDGDLNVTATVFAEPRGGGANCSVAGVPVADRDAFSDDASCAFGRASIEDGGPVLLGPLQDNGGPTPTMMPAPDSPLVDTMAPLDYWQKPLSCADFTDQRGVSRPLDGNGEPPPPRDYEPFVSELGDWCDIGAVEADTIARQPDGPDGPVAANPPFTG